MARISTITCLFFMPTIFWLVKFYCPIPNLNCIWLLLNRFYIAYREKSHKAKSLPSPIKFSWYKHFLHPCIFSMFERFFTYHKHYNSSKKLLKKIRFSLLSSSSRRCLRYWLYTPIVILENTLIVMFTMLIKKNKEIV